MPHLARERKRKRTRKYSEAAGSLVARQMRQFQGKTGPGKRGRPKSRAQAIAIGLSEARRKGLRVPKPVFGRL